MKIPWAALGEYRRRRLIDYLLRDGEDYRPEGVIAEDYYALTCRTRTTERSLTNAPAIKGRKRNRRLAA